MQTEYFFEVFPSLVTAGIGAVIGNFSGRPIIGPIVGMALGFVLFYAVVILYLVFAFGWNPLP